MLGKFFSSSINALIRTCRCCGDVTGVIAGEDGDVTGDVIEVLADEGVVTRVVASEDGRFAGVVAGEARGCSVAAMVQPAVAARCSRWAMSIYCCRVETNGYI